MIRYLILGLVFIFVASTAHSLERAVETIPLPRPRPAILVNVPWQYRGLWCPTNWETIYKRCREPNGEDGMDVTANEVSWGEGTCTPLGFIAMRGRHKVWLTCRVFEISQEHGRRQIQRWRLFANGHRLQVLNWQDQEGE